MKLSRLTLCIVPALSGYLAPLALAQSSSAALEEVVVTASRRAESAQDVAVALTALSSQSLEDANVVDISDIGFLAPNVQLQPVSTFPGFATFTMRGIGTGANSIRTLDPTVNVMIDGMVVATQIAGQLDAFDYETVEVLRGPQGIFFGRNSIAGAIQMRTGKPSEEFGGRVKAGVGSQSLVQLEGVIEGAMSSTLRGKVAVQYRSFDGYFEDNNGGTFIPAPNNPLGTEPGTATQKQNEQDSIFIKPTITWQPSDNFDLTVYGQYFEDDGGSGSTQAYVEPSAAPSTMFRLYGYTPPTDQFEVNHDLVGKSDTEIEQLVVEANWSVGNGVLTSVTGWRDLTFSSSSDIDGTPFLLIHFPNNEEEASQFSQEIRYAADISDRLDFIIGGFYLDAEQGVIERREFSGLTAGRDHFDFNYIQSDWTQDVKSTALFGNIRWGFTDTLTLNAGIRYSREEKDLNITLLTPCSGPGFSGCSTDKTDLGEEWSNTSPRVALEYRPNDELMFWGSWTRGFRSGNYNARAPSIAAVGPADPEQADQIEIGMKGDFADGRLRANITGFFTVYDEIQRTTNGEDALGNPLQLLRNAAEAEIPGIEAELTWLPTDRLMLMAGIGWIDPEFKEFTGLNLGAPTDQENEALAKELEFERVPDFEYTLTGEYRVPMSDRGDLIFRGQYAWRDGFYTDVTNNELRTIDDYGILDASVRFENDKWRVSLWGRNLTEENYADIISAAFNYQRFGGQARTYGVEVGYRF
ncbi:TonB-dependent receptor [Luminiphilus sp.]|nr:TonB-dependent receptor [Luminiphilus sp.]